MQYISNLLKGIFIGAGAILPGISSGVFCVIFGIYEKLVNGILHFFQKPKENVLFLLPILIGVAIGVILFGNFLLFFFDHYPMQASYTFMGLILGSIPYLLQEANRQKKDATPYFLRKKEKTTTNFFPFLCLLFTFTLTVFMLYLENHLLVPTPSEFSNSFSFSYFVLCGICMSAGIVIPGVSSTVILMLLGVYKVYLSAIATLYLPTLFPIGIGLIIGGIGFLLLIQYLLKKYHKATFYGIIGFVLGSILVLYPGFSFNTTGFFSILLFFLSFIVAFSFEKIEKKKSDA